MSIWIVWIIGTDIIGHVFIDKPNVVHYLVDNIQHEQSVRRTDYEILEEVAIEKEDV